MQCPRCGAPVREDKNFCNKCGAPISSRPVPVPVIQKPEAAAGRIPVPPRSILLGAIVVVGIIVIAIILMVVLAPPWVMGTPAGQDSPPSVSSSASPGSGSVPQGFSRKETGSPGVAVYAPAEWRLEAVETATGTVIQIGTAGSGPLIRIYKVSGPSALEVTRRILSPALLRPDYQVTSLVQSPDHSVVQVEASYTENGIAKSTVLTVSIKDGQGIAFTRTGPAASFRRDLTTMNEVLGTLEISEKSAAGSAIPALPLSLVQPDVVHDNPEYDAFPGGITLKIPQGWVAYQKQSDTCSISWWAGESQAMTTQVFSVNSVIIFRSQAAKQQLLDYHLANLRYYNRPIDQFLYTLTATIPVYEDPSPGTFVTKMLSTMGQDAAYQQVYPNFAGIGDMRITRTFREPGYLSGSAIQVAGYTVGFTKSGVPMTGRVLVLTADGSPTWAGYVWGYYAPSESFSRMEPTLQAIMESATITPAWADACHQVTAYADQIRQEMRQASSQSSDTVSENWATYMRDYGYYKDQDGRIIQAPDNLFQVLDQTPAHLGWNPLPFEALKDALPGIG